MISSRACGLLLVLHEMSIDSLYWRDWTQVGGPLSGTPQRCDQRRNDLPVPAHFNSTNHTLDDMKVAVFKAGLANQD